ncbi:hypothetical protein ACFX2G_025259 [Malus domestica]
MEEKLRSTIRILKDMLINKELGAWGAARGGAISVLVGSWASLYYSKSCMYAQCRQISMLHGYTKVPTFYHFLFASSETGRKGLMPRWDEREEASWRHRWWGFVAKPETASGDSVNLMNFVRHAIEDSKFGLLGF